MDTTKMQYGSSSSYLITSRVSGLTLTKNSTSDMLTFIGKMHKAGMHGTWDVVSVRTGGMRSFTSSPSTHAIIATGTFATATAGEHSNG
jgi:hypothetical protein